MGLPYQASLDCFAHQSRQGFVIPQGGYSKHVTFIEAEDLDADDAEAVQAQVRRRILRAFVRRGLLEKEDRKEMEQWDHGGGFSLDAGVRIEAHDRQSLERLLRYCARPPFAADRLEEIDAQRMIYPLPKPGPDGRTQLILSPLELIGRIAALVPPPRQHRHRYYGVLAPNSPMRPAVTALAPAPTDVLVAARPGLPDQPLPLARNPLLSLALPAATAVSNTSR